MAAMHFRFVLLALSGAAMAVADTSETVALPNLRVYSNRVANQEPVASFAMPVTALRYEPLVDVQARNSAEGQSDVAIRGGTFENTGFRIGALSLYDPQTGHYFAEIPVAPSMMTAPAILTGAENASRSWNATTGTVAYGWKPIKTSGSLQASGGEYRAAGGEFYQGYATDASVAGRKVAVDGSAAHSRSDGSRPFGEHEFTRYNARVQLSDDLSQTDIFYGYQSKFFGWPNLYTPFANVYETENIQTNLLALNHRVDLGGGDYVAVGGYYRRNKDHYVFNRADVGAFNPAFATGPAFHRTWVRGFGMEGRYTQSEIPWNVTAHYIDDELRSSSLLFGRYSERKHYKVSVVPEFSWLLDGRPLTAKVGATLDDTNRDESAVSPVAELSLSRIAPDAGLDRVYISYAETTQTTTYFALNSRATAGLFRGNPNLGREKAKNLELGASGRSGPWRTDVAVFYRRDEDLVDWTFNFNTPNARSANAVDIDTTGFEAVVRYTLSRAEFVLGYTALTKSPDYGLATVNASFYALNYPTHRLTAAATLQIADEWTLRIDNEARTQKDNALRRSDDDALLTSLSVQYAPEAFAGLAFTASVENLWDDDFEEVPAVPAARQQVAFGASYSW